ncbi:MAG: tetratricopeptide repeat protein [Deltaproteobacteria bacterium]|nr:MAG: tetratricopeptide repeat protein [Deltaproteobacteria bacterium]
MDELEVYQQMMSKDPSSQVFVYLAEALWEREMYEEAIETCINGLRLRPHDLRARVILGLSYLRTGALDSAETELLKAKEMLEINTVIYRNLAELYDKKGDSEQAFHYQKLFEAIHPSSVAEVETEADEPGSASVAKEALPEDAEMMDTVTLAELYEQQGHVDKAIEVYRKILETSPETEEVEARLAELEKRIGEPQEGRTLLSVLEAWQSKLREKTAPESMPPPSTPPSLDSEKLAAFMRKHAKRLDPI